LNKINRLKDIIRNAFTLESCPEPTEDDLKVLDKVIDYIIKKRLVTSAVWTLYSVMPLNFVSSQLMTVIQPYMDPFISQKDYEKVIRILEHRQGLELFIRRIEERAQSREKNNG